MHWISWSDPVKTRVLVQLLNQRVFRLNRLHHFCQLLVQYNLELLQGSFLQFNIDIKRQPIQRVKASQHSHVLRFYVYYLQDLRVFFKGHIKREICSSTSWPWTCNLQFAALFLKGSQHGHHAHLEDFAKFVSTLLLAPCQKSGSLAPAMRLATNTVCP